MPLILALGRPQRQVDLCKFKANFVYRVHSRIVSKATQKNPISKIKKIKNKRIKSPIVSYGLIHA